MISTEIKNRMKKDDDDKLKNTSSQDSIFKKVGSAVQQASAAKQQAANKAREQVAAAANTATQSATKAVKKNAFDAAYETATQQVKNAAAELRARQVAQFATPASTQPQKTYTATMSSGKQYTFDEDTANWIINRYMQDNADSYGLDDADQLAKKNGQFSAAMRKTYKNTNVDRQLAAMGLPSEKYFEKYLGEYGNWKTGGMDDYFGSMNLPNDYWTKNKSYYQEDWQNAYENTAEDQQRKAAGLMPAKYEAKYTDTEIDDQLRARGLPPVSEFYTYRDKYNAGQEKDALYANAALAQTNLRLAGIKNDDTLYPDGNGGEIKGKDLYAQAFYNEARRTNEDGTYVYGNIMPNFQSGNSSAKTPELTGDYATDQANQLSAEIKSATKGASPTNSNSWGYDDYLANYDDYYNKYFANEKLPGTNQLVSDAIAVKEREADAEATRKYYDVDNSWFGESKKGIGDLVAQYRKEHPTGTYYDMFSDFLKNGVSLTNVRKSARAMQNDTKKNGDFNAISSALAQAEKDWAHTDELDAIYGANGYDVVEGKVIPKGATPVESAAVPEDAKTFFNFGDAYANASREYDTSAEAARAEQKALRNQQRVANRSTPEAAAEQPDADAMIKAARQYGDALASGDRDALYDTTQSIRGLGYNNLEAMIESLKDSKGKKYIQAVTDAIADYDAAQHAISNVDQNMRNPAAATEFAQQQLKDAESALEALGFTYDEAKKYTGDIRQGEQASEQLKEDVADAIRALDDAKTDASLKGDAKSWQAVIDAEQKVTSLLNVGSADEAREWLRTGELPASEATFNGTAVTVDNAINVVETYMARNGGWNAKVAQQAFNELYRMGVSPDIISQAAAEMQDRFGEMEETFTEPEKPDAPGIDSMREYVEANKDRGTDEATVNDTKKALERLLFDEDGNNIVLTNADSVIKAIDSVRNMPFATPAAVDLALKDLGFSANGWFSGVADDLTNGWSTDDMVKLRLALGPERAVDVEPELPDDAKFIQDTFGLSDFWMGNPVSPSQKIMDLDGFATRLDWANQQITAGTLTPGQAYNVLAEDGYHDELETLMGDEWHKAHFKEYIAPGLWAQSAESDKLMWDEMSAKERDAVTERMWEALSDEQKATYFGSSSWWKYDPSVKRTAGQAWGQQAAAILPGLITQLFASTPITILDSIDAAITGRPEMWDVTEKLAGVEQALSNYGSVDDFSFGTRTAEWVTSAAQELIKMETLGSVGGLVGEAFQGTGVGSKILKATASNSKIVSKVADMFMGAVQASPFVAESFAGHYREAKMKGLPNGLAAWYGAVTGLSEGLIEGFNFDKIWGKAIGSDKIVERLMQGGLDYLNMGINGQALLSSLALGFLGEGTEEFVGYAVETGMKNTPSLSPYFSDEEKAWSWKDAGEQALVGGILGVLGAGLHSGSVTTRALITDYAIDKGDAELFRKVAPELAYSIGVAESLSESDLGMYKKGGAKIMSLTEYGQTLDQINNCEEGINKANDEIAKIDADAQKSIDTAESEVAKYDFQMTPYMDTQYGLSPEELNELVDLESKKTTAEITLEDTKRKTTENARVQKAEVQTRIDQAKAQQASLQKKVQEHWVGIYLQNYNGLINGMTDEMVSNIAQAYQNGATYEPETAKALSNQAAAGVDLIRKGANNEAVESQQPKLAEAEANDTMAEAEKAAKTPEDAATKARELAYNRVYKDQEAGKAYAEGRRGEGDSKMTRVQFAENERQNFQAKTTARLRRVTLELAGLEANEGMSAKEIFAEAKKAMTPEAAQKLEIYQKLSKALGLNMVVRDVVAGTSGYVHDGKLYVTLNGKQSMLRVAAHELTHYMKDYASEQYDALRTSLVNEVGQEKFDEMLADKAQEYGFDLNDSKARKEADDEVCAELCERMLENQAALERFVQSDLDAAKTLKQRLGKTLVAIKSAIRTLNISADTKNDLIKEQETIEKWYKGLSDAIDNANAKSKATPTEATTTTITDTTTTEVPQAPPVETNPDLFMGEESARREQLRTDLEALAKNGTRVNGLSYQEVNDVLDRVLFGDKANYSKADLAQIRGMLAQLIPEVTAYVNGDASVDANALNERVSAALDYMLERYSEGSEDYYGLRDLIPDKIALTEAAYNELRSRDMTLREASNELRKALGGKFVSFVYKKSPDYNNAMTIDELWGRITNAYGEPDGYGNIQEDALALIDYAKDRNTRTSFDDLYGSQREDVIGSQVGEFLDAVQSMVDGKAAETAALHSIDDDYMPLAKKYDAGVATEEETDRLRNIVAFAASQSGYEREAYHGTRSTPFTVFDRNLSGQNYGGYNAEGGGISFTNTEGWARRWGAKANGNGAVRTVHAYLNTGKPFYSYDGAVDPSLAKYLPYTMTETEKENAMKSGAAFHKALEDNGVDFYDVMMREGYGSYSMYDGADNVSVYNPSQIKSADLVTYDNDGNIIPLSERFRTDRTGDDAWKNEDIRYSVDDDYLPLAERYDAGIATEAQTEELNADVAEAARAAGYDVLAYHGTSTGGFNIFDYSKMRFGLFGEGFYFTEDPDVASSYMNKGKGKTPQVYKVFLRTGNEIDMDAEGNYGQWAKAADVAGFDIAPYVNEIAAEKGSFGNLTNTDYYHALVNAMSDEGIYKYDAGDIVQGVIREMGFDGIRHIGGLRSGNGKNLHTVHIVFNSEDIKSAAPVTYDDDGDIIPLSERFNPNKTDIRWTVDDDLVEQYGAIEQGREPRARDVVLPKQVDDNRYVSKLTRTVAESSKVTDEYAAEIVQGALDGSDDYTYLRKSNDETMKRARDYIAQRGLTAAQQDFHDRVIAGKLNADTNALGIQLFVEAHERGDVDAQKAILPDLRIASTEEGQAIQIINVLKELKGVGSAWYIESLIDRLNTMYANEIQTGQMDPITVSEEAMQKVRDAKTQAEVDAAEGAVADEIGPQLPLKRDEKLSNWRYLSMLGNPITHGRNVLGNELMFRMGGMKDIVASGVQRILEKTGITDESDRAHARLSRADKAYWDSFAEQSYEDMKTALQGGGKLGFQSMLQQRKRSFDNKILDTIARGKNPGTMSEKKGIAGLFENIRNNGVMGMLEVEDAWGLRKNYKRALMEYMKAQGFSLNNEGKAGKVGKDGTFTEINKEQMDKAIEWAAGQAWANTFRGPSALATELNKISKMNTASKLIIEGVMPFKKTPVNIAKQGAMYSPAGIVIGTTELLTKVKQGKMSAATAIDHLSSGLTGTALMALGVVLAKAGILRGGGEDKKKLETYLEDTGDQTYAFKFGNVSINMSAIAPATIPLFMGVALQEMLSRNGEDEGVDLSTITDVLAGTLNPFMEMSFMSSLNSALKNYNNEGIGGALGSTIMTAAQNYGSQYLPTLGGKVAQFIDPTQRTTKSSATSPVGGNMDYYWRSLVKKVPGAEATLQPDVNIWGKTTTKDSFSDWLLDFANKFVLPTNIKVTNRDAVDNELIRVVESTGEVDFLPSDGAKYFKVKGETYKMNASQYTQYSQERGQAAYAALKDVMAGASYKNATDEQKAELLKKALDNAYKQVNNVWKEKLGAYDN